MSARPEPLQYFLDMAKTAFSECATDPNSLASLRAIFADLETPTRAELGSGTRLDVCNKYLEKATDPDRFNSVALQALARAFSAIEPALTWRIRGGAAPAANESFHDGHANAMVVGPGGIEARNDCWLGVSLLAPNVRYPDHSHAPEETYLVMSKGEFSQDGGPWFEPGVGGSFYNRPNILHAMRSSSEPLFAIWALRPAPR